MKQVTKILVFTAFISALPLQAQQYKNIDSLITEYSTRPTDTSKVHLGTLILQNLIYTNPEEAYKYAHEVVSISKELDYEHGIGLGYNQLGSYFLYKDELDSAHYYTQATLDVVTKVNNLGRILTANERFANLYEKTNDFELAREYLDKNIVLFENRDTITTATEKDFTYIGSTFFMYAELDLRQGRYNLALKNALEALEQYKKRTKDPLFVADAYTLIGRVEMQMENYEQSIVNFEKAFEVYQEFEDLIWQTETLRHIGENLMYLNRDDQAIEHLQKSIRMANENNLQLKEASAYNLLGNAHIKLRKFPEALKSLNRSLEVYSKMDNPTEVNKTYSSLGLLYNEMNEPDTALPFLQKAITISDSLKSISQSAQAYLTRSRSFTQMQNYKSALDDFTKYNAFNDSIFNNTKSQQIEEMRALFDIETKEQQIELQEQEISLLEQKAEINNLQRILMTVGLLLSIIGFYALRQKMKRNKLEKEKVDAELAFKKKELTTHALNLARKNETLENLKSKAQELKVSESTASGYNQLIRTINFDLQDDNNWENFSKYFEQVHRNFNSEIKRKYPTITSNELRLMALLKMNLSSKEIANILNISQDGIKKARYRLRKKLDISTDESLQDLVLSL
ncbi:MAG: tetratricopeptide repeat protein [Aurantibacter sp.]